MKAKKPAPPRIEFADDNTAARAERREWEFARQAEHRKLEAAQRKKEDARIAKAAKNNRVPQLAAGL